MVLRHTLCCGRRMRAKAVEVGSGSVCHKWGLRFGPARIFVFETLRFGTAPVCSACVKMSASLFRLVHLCATVYLDYRKQLFSWIDEFMNT